jgi:hypothetical protein
LIELVGTDLKGVSFPQMKLKYYDLEEEKNTL